MRKVHWGACGAALALAGAAYGADADVSAVPDVKINYEVASGKYGTNANSTSRTLDLSASWYRDSYSFGVDVPQLWQSGPARRVAIGSGKQVVVQPGSSASGVGDVTLDYTRYVLNQEESGVDLDLGGAVKLPTASASERLGTGKTDVSLQATLARSWGPLSAGGTLGYTFVGRPEGSNYRDVAFGSADASVRFDRSLRLGATYSIEQSITPGLFGPRDLTVYAEWKPNKRWRAEVYFSKGYSTQSADRAVGISGTVSF